ncbi:MAG: phosphate signaling complex protein PhoU [Tahibacter sp.]
MTDTHLGNEHTSKRYDAELARLIDEIVRMGALAAEQLASAAEAVDERNSELAARVVERDGAIDVLEQEVSNDVLRLLALRQPIARDLREVLAALRIASDIERIGDYAANVAKRGIALNQVAPMRPAAALPRLAMVAGEMLRDVLAAYRDRDDHAAHEVWERDEELDAMYTALFRELLTYMMEDPRNITPCTHLLFMAKNIERIGDHATNIAENVFFLVHGVPLVEARRKGDLTNLMTSPKA